MTYNYYALKEATLASNITTSSTTIKVRNIFYATREGEVTLKAGTLNFILDAGTDTREFARVVLSTDVTTANNTLTFTNVVRNVSPTSVDIYAGNDTGTTGYAHGAGARVMVSPANTQHFSEFAVKNNEETIPGDWHFTGQTSFLLPPTSPDNVDASASVKGVSKLSVAPASPANPIAVGDNDIRIPTANPTTLFSPLKSSVTRVYTANSTWTKPSDLLFAVVEMVSGGGPGHGLNNNKAISMPSGASGGYAKKMFKASDLTATVAITVGIAGVGNTGAGTPGGQTSFGSYVICGGASSSTGGTATGGDINIPGQLGGGSKSLNTSTGAGGFSFGGGSNPLGQGAVATINSATNGVSGLIGTGYGAGGGGAGADNWSNCSANGGNGTPGILIITEYF